MGRIENRETEAKRSQADIKAQEANDKLIQQANATAVADKTEPSLRVEKDLITDLSKVPPMPFHSYKGTRTSYICYHPLYHGEDTFAFDRALPVFMKQWTEWWDIAELYQDEMVLSEKVTVPQLRKDVTRILKEICAERDVYKLEALAEALWDKEGASQDPDGSYTEKSEKTSRHELPYMSELKHRASELRALDCGISLGYPIPKNMIIRHTWSG